MAAARDSASARGIPGCGGFAAVAAIASRIPIAVSMARMIPKSKTQSTQREHGGHGSSLNTDLVPRRRETFAVAKSKTQSTQREHRGHGSSLNTNAVPRRRETNQ